MQTIPLYSVDVSLVVTPLLMEYYGFWVFLGTQGSKPIGEHEMGPDAVFGCLNPPPNSITNQILNPINPKRHHQAS